jgi:hypothetical protein
MALPDFFTLVGLSSFIFQVAIVVLLIAGYGFKRKQRFRLHGATMAFATILHLAAISAIMVPSLIYAFLPQYIAPTPAQLISIVTLIHVVAGSVAIAFGVWFTAAWRFGKDVQGCLNRKKPMRYTFAVWLVALIFGIILFAVFYGPKLFV